MKTNQNRLLRFLLAFAVSAVLTAGFQISASAAPGADQQTARDWMRHRQEWMTARLAKAAQRLQIQPAQQGPWQAYVDAVTAPIDLHRDRDAANDAASIARRRADFAAAHASKMARIADATAALQSVLTPDQRQKFDKMVKHAHPHGPHGWAHADFHRADMHRAGDTAPEPVAPVAP